MDEKTRLMLKFITPQRKKPNPSYAYPEADRNLQGKTVVLTGGTDGMGRAAAQMFHDCGADLVLLGRNQSKGDAVLEELNASGGHRAISFERCDLASMPSIKACAERILAEHSQIDILVNCAGVNSVSRTLTDEGFETNWAINYLGPFLLTTLLLERIKASGTARIVNLVTNLVFLEKIDLNDLQSEKNYDPTNAYTQAKIAMGMYTKELSLQLKGTDVTANYLNPGFVTTNLLRDFKGAMKLIQFLNWLLASPAEVGGDRILRLAASSAYSGVTGSYISEDNIKPPHAEVRDGERRKKLMQISNEVVSPWL